jgi:hypothetical protein
MTLKVNQRRLIEPLKAFGFVPGIRTYTVPSFTFVRPSYTNHLFESIIVEAQGKQAEAIVASIGVAVTRTVKFKIMGDVRLCVEMAEDKERGWTFVRNEEKAKQWENELVRIAPPLVREWATTKGEVVLAATLEARNAVENYMDRLQPFGDLREVNERLRRGADSRTIEAADRMYSGGVEGTETAHDIACLAVLLFSGELENGKSYFGCSSLDDVSLMQRIKILADRLMMASERTNLGGIADA